MSNRALETLTWVLIYGGLLTCGLGLAVGDRDAGLSLGLLAGGAAAAVGGVVLIWVRSRRSAARSDPPPHDPR